MWERNESGMCKIASKTWLATSLGERQLCIKNQVSTALAIPLCKNQLSLKLWWGSGSRLYKQSTGILNPSSTGNMWHMVNF